MSRFELEKWDSGKVTVNKTFAELLRLHGWNTFDDVWARSARADITKNVRTDRVTLRFTLRDGDVERVFYIKRHSRSSWKEYIKPLLRLTWPILGARNEWNAIMHFHKAQIATMTPVALGESGEHSFLITEGLENCTKLSHLDQVPGDAISEASPRRISLLKEVALVAQRMHGAGLHHQDFYLGHLMLSQTSPEVLYVIDLGRVQKQNPLAQRWIIKDLAQLNYSADASNLERLRFLRAYLGRRINRADLRMIRQIQAKSARIGRHTAKNQL